MNILLVDDQPSIIAALVSCIPWHDLGIHTVLTAGSARDAKNTILKHHVDILITDIEMPVEDGLDLLTWVRNQNLDMECILLTAHADFFYAKRAISLQVSDYIIQPARDEDVIRAVKKAVATRQTKSRSETLIRYHGQDFAVKNVAAQSIFETWPSSRDAALEPEQLQGYLRRLSGFGMECTPKDSCILLRGNIRIWHKFPQSPPVMLTKYRQILDGACRQKRLTHITWFPENSNFFTAIFTPLTDYMRQALEQAYASMEPELGCSLRLLYCGTDMRHIQEALSSLEIAEKQFALSHEAEDVCFRQVALRRSDWESDPQETRNTKLLEQIKKYIRDNMSEPITRTQIADALYVSAGQVSHVIKELEDMSCKELITKMKMEYARKLLRLSKFSIGDIAIQCGYDSFAYFSKVYKDTFGISPSTERDNAAAQ